jgi:AraC family transcriptional regulator
VTASAARLALDRISVDVIRRPPERVAELRRHRDLITTPWPHPELHDDVPALPVHVVGTYYGAPSERVWTDGRMRLAGTGRPGAIAIVPADHGGRWDIASPAPVSYVMLSDARLQDVAAHGAGRGRVELVPRVGELDPVGAHLLQALGDHAADPDRAGTLLIEQTLDLLCRHLVRVHSTRGDAGSSIARHGALLPWQIRRVAAYLHDRFDRDITLDDMARQLGLSRFHFCTAFRRATGQTPHQWLTALRIARARELLRDPRRPVSEIGLAVGYHTHSAFAATFRKVTGMTPTEFRRAA